MRPILRYAAILSALFVGLPRAEAPRWGFQGDDESLEVTFDEAKHVAFVCVTEVELRDVNPPFADVVYHATVIESHKGKLSLGDRIRIVFSTDSLPNDDEERRKFVEGANKKNKGDLKFAFLQGGEEGAYFCDFVDVPTYTSAMQDFLRELQVQRVDRQAEQGGAGQPATRSESDSKGGDKLQPESEGRSR